MITIKKSKLKVYPDWHELYSDVNIEYGGLFVNPDNNTGIEVIDLDSASGVDYVNLITRGSFYVDERMIRSGAETCGIDAITAQRIIRVFQYYDKRCYWIYSKFLENFPPGTTSHNLLLQGFYLSHSYMGFDGYPDYSWIVLPKKTRNNPEGYTEQRAKQIMNEWSASEYVFASDNGKAIRRILKDQGINLRRK